jgi:hypothetical protein
MTARTKRAEFPIGRARRQMLLEPTLSTLLFHKTTSQAAKGILQDGFRDGRTPYMADREFSGIWLSDRPLNANDGVWGNTLLEVLVDLTADALVEWEWVEEGKPYREWLIPAALLNPNCRVRIVEE